MGIGRPGNGPIFFARARDSFASVMLPTLATRPLSAPPATQPSPAQLNRQTARCHCDKKSAAAFSCDKVARRNGIRVVPQGL